MANEFLSAFVLLFLVCDPIGNVPLAGAALANAPRHRWRHIVWREVCIAWAVLVAFLLIGQDLLRVMKLSESSMSIAGGVVLFLIALRMIFPTADGVFGPPGEGEPFIVPIAIPAIAGPSSMATVMLLASQSPQSKPMLAGAITAVMLCSGLTLSFGEWLQARLGSRGARAFERLMGLMLAAISVEMMLGGVRGFVATLGR